MNNIKICLNKYLQWIYCVFYTWAVSVFSVVLLPHVVFSQPVTCVTVEGLSSMDGLSPGEAKEKAIKNARGKALFTALANDISIDALEIAMEIEGDIQGAIPYGLITRETIVEENKITDPHDKTSRSPFYRVKLEACCQAQKKKKPEFSIAASLNGNKHSFKPGDTLSLSIQSSHDCYIYLFNLLKGEKEDQVIRWFPNKYDTENFVKANSRLVFPKSETMKIRLSLPAGKSQITDYIYVLALKAPSDMEKSSVVEGLKEEYGGKPSKMEDFITDLVMIPFSQRSEALLKYRIKK